MKKMRRIAYSCLVLALIGITNQVQAQNGEVYVWGSTGLSSAYNRGFSNFADNYNRYAAAKIVKPLGGFAARNMDAGITLGLGRQDNFGGQVSFFASNLLGKASVSTVGDEKRVFDLRRHQVGIEWVAGPQFRSSALYFGLGFQLGNTILDSYYIYGDGSESHGRERLWNGIYRGLNWGIFFTGRYNLKLSETLGLFAKLNYCRDVSKKSHLSDHLTRNSLTTGWAGSTMLPLDVEQYVALHDAPGFGPQFSGPWVMNKFTSLSLQLGLSINLRPILSKQ